MNKFELYQHQKGFCRGIVDSIEIKKSDKVIGEAPTGFGKTVVSAALLDYYTNQVKVPTMFFVNRIELVQQSIHKFSCIENQLSVIKAGSIYKHLFKPERPCQLTMLQTWYSQRKNFENLKPEVILIDEVHEGWNTGRMSTLLEMYPEAKIIGLSATPIDDKGVLLKGFDDHIRTVQVKDLQKMINPVNGLPFLAKDINYMPADHDYSHVKMRGSDYDADELAEECSQDYLVKNVVDLHKKDFRNLKTLVFCVNIKHAEVLNQQFRDQGYLSAVLHSNMKNSDRQRILKLHKEGRLDVLLNVGILTTGYDDPSLQCIILAYPTQSLRKLIQMLGRGGRIQEGKTEFVVIDFGGNIRSNKHGTWSAERHYENHKLTRESVYDSIVCPECFCVIEEKPVDRRCPECGFLITKQVEEREVKEKEYKEAQELVRIQEIKYKNETSIELLRELVSIKNEDIDVSLFFYKHLYSLKPEEWSEDFFNKKLHPIIKEAIRNRRKTFSVVYKLKDVIHL